MENETQSYRKKEIMMGSCFALEANLLFHLVNTAVLKSVFRFWDIRWDVVGEKSFHGSISIVIIVNTDDVEDTTSFIQ